MIWVRLLIVLFVTLCPPPAGGRIAAVADRAEEHHEADPSVDLVELLRHRQIQQARRRRVVRRRQRQFFCPASGLRPASPLRRSRVARVFRRLHYSNDDDPDPLL